MKELILPRGRTLSFERPLVMGIVNTTPDSFSDGGQFLEATSAIEHAKVLLEQGADILDIGGESTRPGAAAVCEADELQRVIPVIKGIRAFSDVPISIDTSKAQVMTQAIEAGADMINDVCALQMPGALDAAAALNVPVCLMHMQGEPRSMQDNPSYSDVCDDILRFFQARIDACRSMGIVASQLILDPGFGFGKTLSHNYKLLAEFASFQQLGLPLLAGVSRKSMIGNVINKPAEQRVYGSVAAATIAALQGAHIIRVHDVAATVDAMKVVTQTLKETICE